MDTFNLVGTEVITYSFGRRYGRRDATQFEIEQQQLIESIESELSKCQRELAEQTRLVEEYKRLVDEAQKQEPFLYVYNTNAEHRELEYQVIAKEHQNDPDVIKLYRAPIPAQPRRNREG